MKHVGADCGKPLEQIALESLNPEHKDLLAGLEVGMKFSEVAARIGQPTDQVFMATSRSLIPANLGSDQFRAECAYKGVGRLTFSSDGARRAWSR